MAKPVGAVWKIQWSNPYTNPPEGQERVITKKFVWYESEFYNRCPSEFSTFNFPGYGLFWSAVMKPSKQLPESTLKSIRRKRLERRVENKYPLFADEFIQEELESKSEYYDGKTDPDLKTGRDQVFDRMREIYEEFLENVE
jgi:hypothetical protein